MLDFNGTVDPGGHLDPLRGNIVIVYILLSIINEAISITRGNEKLNNKSDRGRVSYFFKVPKPYHLKDRFQEFEIRPYQYLESKST